MKIRTLTKWEAFVWRIKHWRRFVSFTIPLTKGRALHVNYHHWTGFKLRKYEGECTCVDMWIMWISLSLDYGTCNFGELEKSWFRLCDIGNRADE